MQEYHYHLGAVNTITYVEDNTHFVSSADDKTLRVWELGIPVQVCSSAAAQRVAIVAWALGSFRIDKVSKWSADWDSEF